MADEESTLDNYELLNCVATGAATQIWEVTEQGGTEHFAMKLLLPEAFEEAEQIRTLKHEAKVARTLDHPNFVRYRDCKVTKKYAFMVMEYFRAPNLKALILNDLPSAQIRIRKLVESVTLALAYMHRQGWVHRDIKPDNILFNKASEVRLIDFSLAARAASGFSKMLGGKAKAIQGTRTYIAPETLKKQRPTPQTDMYSLGVTLYEVLVGAPPFRGNSPNELLRKHLQEKPFPPSEFNPNVAPEADNFIARLLAKKPSQRFQDMNEVYAEFRSLKIFKEDVEELQARQREQQKQADEEGDWKLGERADSRGDAQRSQKQTRRPQAPQKKQKKAPPPQQQPQAGQPQQQPPSPAPAAYQHPQQPPPGYPPYQGQPMPGWYPPPQMPAGQPWPPGYGPYPPGQQPPGQQPPGQQPPGQQPPMGTPPGTAPPPNQPAPQQPAGTQPPGTTQQPGNQSPGQEQQPGTAPPEKEGQQPPAEPPQQKPPKQESDKPGGQESAQQKDDDDDDDDLPLMEELPEVI